ncbi:MAG: hypothetical protein ABEH43_08945 [Flavobacteriales bacterium]
MFKYRIFVFLMCCFIFTSCRNIFNAIFLEDQCKECKVINTLTGEVLWEKEGCGGNLTRLDEKAKIQAYNKSHDIAGGDLCELEISCKSYEKEDEDD